VEKKKKDPLRKEKKRKRCKSLGPHHERAGRRVPHGLHFPHGKLAFVWKGPRQSDPKLRGEGGAREELRNHGAVSFGEEGCSLLHIEVINARCRLRFQGGTFREDVWGAVIASKEETTIKEKEVFSD